MTHRLDTIRRSLRDLHAAAQSIGRPVKLMEVCGTHTMSAFRSGLHSLMPENLTLLSGPGCPVCVTAQGDIDLMIELAGERGITLCTYGDMLRVPGERGSLERARSGGADVRVVYSTLDAVKLAGEIAPQPVVFAAVGFETTAPATAAAVLQAQRRRLSNFSVLASHKRVVPAMLALLQDPATRGELDGFLCPGHVSVIIGANAYNPIIERYGIPCVIGGFEEPHMISALQKLVEQVRDGNKTLGNEYPQVVTPQGNCAAQACIDAVFHPIATRWRGLGVIPDSGLTLHAHLAEYDAMHVYGLTSLDDHEPHGCLCGQVISGRAVPTDCKLFGTACTPIRPIGPCMVSSEGTCQAWFKYQRGKPPKVQLELAR
jgi:hydrogenase expression/formation protein HypD